MFSLALSKCLKNSESVANILSSGDLCKTPNPVCVLWEAYLSHGPWSSKGLSEDLNLVPLNPDLLLLCYVGEPGFDMPTLLEMKSNPIPEQLIAGKTGGVHL